MQYAMEFESHRPILANFKMYLDIR